MITEKFAWSINDHQFCVWSWNLENGTVGLSGNWRSFLGFEEELSSNKEWFHSVLHPEDLPKILTYFEEQLTGAGNQEPFYFRLRHKNQHYLYFESKGSVVIQDPKGLPGHLIWGCEKVAQE